MKDLLNVISECMSELEINYDYIELKNQLSYPYVIGEYFESNYVKETNGSEGEFLLTIWDRNLSSINIIELNQKIKQKFGDLRVIKNGTAIHLSYANSLPELQDIEDLKKQEIRIDVKYFEKGE